MYPFVISWTSEYLNEWFENRSFNYGENFNDINNLIYKYIDEIIKEYEDIIKYAIEDERFNLETFYQIVNKEPYCDYLFFSIKYFDILHP